MSAHGSAVVVEGLRAQEHELRRARESLHANLVLATPLDASEWAGTLRDIYEGQITRVRDELRAATVLVTQAYLDTQRAVRTLDHRG